MMSIRIQKCAFKEKNSYFLKWFIDNLIVIRMKDSKRPARSQQGFSWQSVCYCTLGWAWIIWCFPVGGERDYALKKSGGGGGSAEEQESTKWHLRSILIFHSLAFCKVTFSRNIN